MPTIEDDIKNIIIKGYGTIAEFSRKSEIPYTTIDSMLKRGIKNSNVQNVMNVCDALKISVDSLKHGLIKPADPDQVERDTFYSEIKHLANLVKTEEQKKQVVNFLKFVTKNDDK